MIYREINKGLHYNQFITFSVAVICAFAIKPKCKITKQRNRKWAIKKEREKNMALSGVSLLVISAIVEVMPAVWF